MSKCIANGGGEGGGTIRQGDGSSCQITAEDAAIAGLWNNVVKCTADFAILHDTHD